MKTVPGFFCCVAIIFIFAGSVCGNSAVENEPPSLAVLVDYEPADKEFADKLQSLLEAEAAMQWDGRLLERAELDKLLGELKLSVSGLADPNSRLQLGKIIRLDCLLTVRAAKDSVKVTARLFPSTTIIHEKTYRQRLQPHPLALVIVTDAMKAFREHGRKSNLPQVSVGSFYYADPHRKFLDFSIDIGLKLRRELVEDKTIVLTERLFPSDLLSEFELVRGGFTEQIAKNLSAPPSDILLYGEFQPKPEQDLAKPVAELDFTLLIVSPTGMCENLKLDFSCRSNEPQVVIEQALKLIEKTTEKVRTRLAAGLQRRFSQQEFEEFKRQAFRLMPNPPLEDGDFYKQGHYRGPRQSAAKPEEYERALHMLECAMLFKGDDTQVLVCTGAVLNGMSGRLVNWYSESTKQNFLKAGLELIERAYFIDSNWNTRGMYANFCLFNPWSPNERPSIALIAAQQIWNTRNTEPWHSHQIHSAFRTIFAKSDFQEQTRLFIETAPEYEKKENGLRNLSWIFQDLCKKFSESETNQQDTLQKQLFAERLMDERSLFLKSLGEILLLTTYLKIEESGEGFNFADEFSKHLQIAIDMLPELYKNYGKQFADTVYSGYLRILLEKYHKMIKKYNMKDNAAELQEIYLEEQMKVGNYNSVENALVFYTMLPSMWEQHQYDRGYELLTRFIENSRLEGSVPMKLLRERNKFMFAMQDKIPLDINQFQKIEFDDNKSGSVTKLVPVSDKIFGVRGDQQFRYGKAFQFLIEEQKAKIIKHISGDVRDIACTEKFTGIATLNGLYLYNNYSLEIKRFDTQNSNLPGQQVRMICEFGKDFLIGIPDKENLYTLVYYLEPDTTKIRNTNTKVSPHNYWKMKPNRNQLDDPVIFQSWYYRSVVIDNKMLEFLCDNRYTAIKKVTVNSNKNDLLLNYQGFELSHVYDFTLWQGQLIFATGNGLYISEPYSNELRCLISEPDLLFFSLCPLDERMYIGTSNGLYCVSSESFLEMVREVDELQ